MEFQDVIDKVGIYAASFVIGFISGLVPFVNSELYLLVVSPLASKPALAPIAALSALGQMVAKSLLFYAGRGALKIPMGRYEKKIEKVQQKFIEWENKLDLLIFVSAFVGFPPFYAVSVVAGSMKLNFTKFAIVGLVGRTMRFLAIVYFPQLVMRFI
jgi:membrane protein YqaA with SNARE-associated domain